MGTKQLQLVGLCLVMCAVVGMILGGELRAQGVQDVLKATQAADALFQRAEYAAAIQQYERALEFSQKVYGQDHDVTVLILTDLGRAYTELGQYAKAEPLLQRNLKYFEAKLAPNHLYIAQSLDHLGNLYGAMGQYAKAEPLYQRSLKLREASLGPNNLLVASSLNNLANLYMRTEQYTKAEPLYQRSLKIFEATQETGQTFVADALNNLAVLYYELGQYAKAEPLHRRSLQIREATLGPEHPDVAQSLDNLGNIYVAMREYAKAEPFYQRGLKIREARLGPDHPDVADSIHNLARLYFQMGRYAQAEPLYQRSLQIREAALGPEHPQMAVGFHCLAALYMYMGQYAKSEPLYQRCLKIRETAFGPDHNEVSEALDGLSILHHLMGQFDLAAQEFDRSRRIVRHYASTILAGLSEREQLTFLLEGDSRGFKLGLTMGYLHRNDPKFAAVSYGWLLNGKAVVQQSLAERALLTRDSADPALAAKIQQLLAVRKKLAELSLVVPAAGQAADHRRQLAELSRQEQELSRAIYLSAGRPGQDERWVEPAAVRGAIAKDSVLVDIACFEPLNFDKLAEKLWLPARYVAWIVPPEGQGEVQIVDLGEAAAIDVEVAKARKAIEQSALRIDKAEDEEPAQQAALGPLTALAELVLNPLKPHLAGVKQLILSPDANLWLVPWAALPVEPGKFAIETWQIRHVISGRDLVGEQPTGKTSQRQPNRSCIFADPDYDLDAKRTLAATRAVLRGKEGQMALRGTTGRSASGLPRAGRLPATAVEARLIAPGLQVYAARSAFGLYGAVCAGGRVENGPVAPRAGVKHARLLYAGPERQTRRPRRPVGLRREPVARHRPHGRRQAPGKPAAAMRLAVCRLQPAAPRRRRRRRADRYGDRRLRPAWHRPGGVRAPAKQAWARCATAKGWPACGRPSSWPGPRPWSRRCGAYRMRKQRR